MKTEHESWFEEVTTDEEKMVWTYRPTLLTYLADYRELWYTIGVTTVLLVSFAAAEMVTPERLVPWKFFPAFLAAAVVAVGYAVVKRKLLHRYVGYALSEKRVLIKGGLLTPTYKAIELSKITSVDVSRDPLQYLLGTGTIRIATGESKLDEFGLADSPCDQLEGVRNPYGVLKEILRRR